MSSASGARGAARARSTSTSTSARASPRTAPRWARSCSRTSRRRAHATLDRIELVSLGPNTVTKRSALVQELDRVRDAGLAVNNEELAYGLRSIAVPVRARSGEVEAAINLAVHRTMVSMDDLTARLGPALERTAAEISARAGYRDGRGRVTSVASTETRRATAFDSAGSRSSSRSRSRSPRRSLIWELVSRTGLISRARPAGDERRRRRALVADADERLLDRVRAHRARLGARPRDRDRARRADRDLPRLERASPARAFRVPIEFLRPIPSAALIPLLFLTLGTTLKSEVFLAAFGAFWPLLDPDDVRRARRRPARDRHRPLVRPRPASSASTASRCRARCRTS